MVNFVLVHGAMHGGWCWKNVRSILAKAGYSVLTPTLTGQGERRRELSRQVGVETHVEDVLETLWFEDIDEVHLVLHSYAGILAGPIAERAVGRLSSITFLGAFLVRPENAYSMSNRQRWQPAIVSLLRRRATGGAYLPPLIFLSNGASPIPL